MKLKWNEKVYALYKGEKFITDGTIPEIHQATGKSIIFLKYMTYPSYDKKRGQGPNGLKMVPLDDDE